MRQATIKQNNEQGKTFVHVRLMFSPTCKHNISMLNKLVNQKEYMK
jgi:hypothetical protein